ncbi:hypothetical protein [Neptunomonas phycophila]|uniref:hypothetical protein n=1 Tax=Neptunomonas phycophila TaxID=1572645 RepID=UPI001BEA51BD|nr:hypothetical protein [Neptunomonas phycophila]MBT3145655.1 hypothetical protein [Neptunomonas phycophila]
MIQKIGLSLITLMLFTGCTVADFAPVTSIQEVRNSEACDVNPLTSDDVERFFKLATEVSTGFYHAQSVILPCYWEGKMESSDQQLFWQINASGAGIIQSEDGSVDKRFLCKAGSECCASFPAFCE